MKLVFILFISVFKSISATLSHALHPFQKPFLPSLRRTRFATSKLEKPFLIRSSPPSFEDFSKLTKGLSDKGERLDLVVFDAIDTQQNGLLHLIHENRELREKVVEQFQDLGKTRDSQLIHFYIRALDQKQYDALDLLLLSNSLHPEIIFSSFVTREVTGNVAVFLLDHPNVHSSLSDEQYAQRFTNILRNPAESPFPTKKTLNRMMQHLDSQQWHDYLLWSSFFYLNDWVRVFLSNPLLSRQTVLDSIHLMIHSNLYQKASKLVHNQVAFQLNLKQLTQLMSHQILMLKSPFDTLFIILTHSNSKHVLLQKDYEMVFSYAIQERNIMAIQRFAKDSDLSPNISQNALKEALIHVQGGMHLRGMNAVDLMIEKFIQTMMEE